MLPPGQAIKAEFNLTTLQSPVRNALANTYYAPAGNLTCVRAGGNSAVAQMDIFLRLIGDASPGQGKPPISVDLATRPNLSTPPAQI